MRQKFGQSLIGLGTKIGTEIIVVSNNNVVVKFAVDSEMKVAVLSATNSAT